MDNKEFKEEYSRYVLRHNKMYLPLSVDEGIYLRGALKSAIKLMKNGDEREFCRSILSRLEEAVLDLQSYHIQTF